MQQNNLLFVNVRFRARVRKYYCDQIQFNEFMRAAIHPSLDPTLQSAHQLQKVFLPLARKRRIIKNKLLFSNSFDPFSKTA
jgi:hypothetical protein